MFTIITKLTKDGKKKKSRDPFEKRPLYCNVCMNGQNSLFGCGSSTLDNMRVSKEYSQIIWPFFLKVEPTFLLFSTIRPWILIPSIDTLQIVMTEGNVNKKTISQLSSLIKN